MVSYSTDYSKGKMPVMLSPATNLDVMAVGLSMAFLHVAIFYPEVIIGLVTFGLSVA